MDHMILLSGDMALGIRWAESIIQRSDEPMLDTLCEDLRMLRSVPMRVRVCLLEIVTSISGAML